MAKLDGLVGAEPIPAGADFEQFVNGIGKFVGLPLRIVGAGFVYVADSDTLDVGLFQEMKHNSKTLSANADESKVEFVTGWNVADAAQDVAGNNRKASGG